MLKVTSTLACLSLMLAGAVADMTSGFLDAEVHDSPGGMATCVTGLVPLENVQATNNIMNFNVTDSQIEVTQRIVTLQSLGIGAQGQIAGTHQVTTSLNISATLCVPKDYPTTDDKAIQILTHGGGYGHGYWEFLPDLSYVDVAAKHGAATFNYDRFGIGKSSTPGGEAPLQLVQMPMHVEILQMLTQKLKNGDFSDTTYSKVVATGHSIGSVITVGLAASYPEAADGVILTGFSTNSSGISFFTASLDLRIANQNNQRFAHLGDGYLVPSDVNAQQASFLHYPGFTPEALQQAEDTKDTTTFGEMLSFANVLRPAADFVAPVFVANGIYDFAFCGGNCTVPVGNFPDITSSVVPQLFPNVTKEMSGSMNYENAGHGLNAQQVAPEAFEDIQKFITAHGL